MSQGPGMPAWLAWPLAPLDLTSVKLGALPAKFKYFPSGLQSVLRWEGREEESSLLAAVTTYVMSWERDYQLLMCKVHVGLWPPGGPRPRGANLEPRKERTSAQCCADSIGYLSEC